MKIFLSMCLIALLATNTVNAGDCRDKKGHDIDKLASTLQLDDAKAQELKAIMDTHHSEKDALRESHRDARHEMHERQREDLLKVLSQEQLDAFEKNMRRPRHKRPPE